MYVCMYVCVCAQQFLIQASIIESDGQGNILLNFYSTFVSLQLLLCRSLAWEPLRLGDSPFLYKETYLSIKGG